MYRDVSLFINVFQNFKGQDKAFDDFEMFTKGRMGKRKDKWIVEYENEYNGKSKILLFDDGCVDIISKGDVCYTLRLDEKNKTKFSCNTKDVFSYFSVHTKNIFFEIDEKGGKINLEYDLEIDSMGGKMNNKIQIVLK